MQNVENVRKFKEEERSQYLTLAEQRDTLALINPMRLIEVYKRPRLFTRPEDEQRHRIIFKDGIYQVPKQANHTKS